MVDELNLLQTTKTKKRAIPYRQYFEEMDLSEEQINERVEHSKKLHPILLFILNLIVVYYEYNTVSIDTIAEELRERYIEALAEMGDDIDSTVIAYVDKFSKDFVETTVKRISDEYYTSNDRAEVTAENEANTILNFEDFKDALESGKKYKTWITERDDRVRDTHVVMEGVTIPIDDYFTVGDSYMLYPKDTGNGASMEEISNCRCSIPYS